MKKNIGSIDKAIRIVIALSVGILAYLGILSGIWATVLGVVAVVLLLTAFIGFCPLYLPFRINTKKKSS